MSPNSCKLGTRNGDVPARSVRRSQADGMTARAGIRGSIEAAEIYVHTLMVANERTLYAHHRGAHPLVRWAYQQVRVRTPTRRRTSVLIP